ncbi:MAG: septum formation inhibitor Maf [Pseudomonadales bacterium]|jgi:septum formation protein|nr:septum formation inhibitor Maf [Pseudomonadales bacterium]HMU89556.1 Maf family protein [Pseudomonadales bacterium]HMW14703.1 Maf family protein [Pseudomonadales bacterium]HMW82800.1 Maf family protein [Pseudomonadales bacterium]HMZ90848.1 Maf family protein [Pseudomonadales bacterium]
MDAPGFVYLASASPRRRALLEQIAVPCRLLAVNVDESPLAGESSPAHVLRLAQAKAETGRDSLPLADAPVLGADTVVVAEADEILGKPRDRDHFMAMMTQLSGRWHRVISAVAVVTATACHTAVVTTRVRFRPLDPAELARYWESGEPLDKAGGYAIQGLAAPFVERIEGSYSAVVGLPLRETQALLARCGMVTWPALDRSGSRC